MHVEPEERREIAASMTQSLRRSGLSQADFARLIGTSTTRLSMYLSGTTMPSAAMYLRALRIGAALEQTRTSHCG
jgi:transcriptional regulator with XRE-family HTH domain